MAGMALGGVLLAVALFLFGRSMLLRYRDRLLMSRLLAVKARVTDPGSNRQTLRLVPGREDIEYVGQYEYRIGDKTYVGTVTSNGPVFRKEQMPPHEITVFYDAANVSVSRLSATVPDDTPKAFTISAFVALVVAVFVAIIPNLEWIVRQLSE